MIYITTNKDINNDKNLLKTASTLSSDDILFMLSLDIEHSPESLRILQNAADKKKFSLKQYSLTEGDFADDSLDLNNKCNLAIKRIVDQYLKINQERKLIFVGYTIIPTMLSLYGYLREHNVQLEARMVSFNATKNILTDKGKIQMYYERWLKSNKNQNKKISKRTLELAMDDDGDTTNVTVYKQTPILIHETDEDDVEIVGIISNEDDRHERIDPKDVPLLANDTQTEKCPEQKTDISGSVPEDKPDDSVTDHTSEESQSSVETVKDPKPDIQIPETQTENNKKVNEPAAPADVINVSNHPLKKFGNKVVNTFSKKSMGRVAGKNNEPKQETRYQDSQGNPLIEKKKTREEIEESIFRKEIQKEEEKPEYSPELIHRLQEYEQLIDRSNLFLRKQLKIDVLDNKDFYTLINLVQTSTSPEELIQNMAIELPCHHFEVISDKDFIEYRRVAREVTEATNQFSI